MAAPKAPVLDAAGKKAKDVTLAAGVFGAEVRPHLVHEAVRAEAAAARAGTQAAKSRGMVSGGTSKPWRQKGTGRARAGSTRAPQWTGGGLAFPPRPRSYVLKVNRKARRSAFRSALSDHAGRGTLAVVDGGLFAEPSTRAAAAFVATWGAEQPLLVVALPEEETLVKSFRNLDRVLVLGPSELEVGALVWARSVLATEGALARITEVNGS
jgi:large subunit ribosomal protein L4